MLYKCSNKGEVRPLEVPCPADLVPDVFGLPDHLTEFPTTLQGRSSSSTSTWAGLQVYYTWAIRGDLVLFLWRQLAVNFLWQFLSAVVRQVGPDDLLLGEAEDTQPTAFQGVVNYVSRVSHNILSLKDSARRVSI